MKAIVFGGTGFVGSHVADVLSEKGFDVTIFDKEPSKYTRKDQQMIVGDIRSIKDVTLAMQDMDYVLNFAAIADLTDAREQPFNAAQVNILGNLNILEGMKSLDIKRYMFASTYYVYSNSGSIYRVTKQSCELFIEEYARLFDIPYTILRFGSLYGPRSNEKNAVYKLLKSAIMNKKIIRQGSGEDLREYIHVLDAAYATHETMQLDEYKNRHVILTGNQQIQVSKLHEMVKEMMENKISIEYQEASQSDTDHYSITPYTFKPQVAVRYLRQNYYDLGQGMLELLYQLHEELNVPNLSIKADGQTL